MFLIFFVDSFMLIGVELVVNSEEYLYVAYCKLALIKLSIIPLSILPLYILDFTSFRLILSVSLYI